MDAAVALVLSAKSGSRSRNLSHIFRNGVGCSGFCRLYLYIYREAAVFNIYNEKQKFVFLGRQTINSNQHLLFQQTNDKKSLHKKLKFHHPKKRGRGERYSRRIFMCPPAAISNYASNWGGWGAAWASLYIYFLCPTPYSLTCCITIFRIEVYHNHRWALSPISVISDIRLSLISELPISDCESRV